MLEQDILPRQKLLEIAKRADEKIAENRRTAPTSPKEEPDLNLPCDERCTLENSLERPAEMKAPTVAGEKAEIQEYDWARLDRFAQIIESLEVSKEVMDKRAAQKRLRDDLNRQMADVRRRKQRDQEENMEYAKNVESEVNQWREYSQRMGEATRVKASIERQDRDEQIRYNEELKKADIEKRTREDRELLSRISDEIRFEERERIDRKIKEKEVMHRLITENEKEQQRKLELKRLATEAELEQIREYNSLIEKQEKERQAELDRRLERQRLLIRKMEENVLKTIQAKADDDNQRALMQQAERDARDIEIEKFKQTNLTRMRHEMIETLHEQMKQKHSQKQEESELRRLHAAIMKADTQAFVSSENEKMRERKEIYRRYRDQLREQMNEARSRRNKVGETMTVEEVRLNSDLINIVEKVLRDEPISTLNNAT